MEPDGARRLHRVQAGSRVCKTGNSSKFVDIISPNWRRWQDSNLRHRLRCGRVQNGWHKPLAHISHDENSTAMQLCDSTARKVVPEGLRYVKKIILVDLTIAFSCDCNQRMCDAVIAYDAGEENLHDRCRAR